MSWKMLEKPRTVVVSKSLIEEFVTMDPAPYDRPLSERRLQVYERILKAGDFRPVVWASALCHETNNIYRVNGKHTSILLSKLDKLPDFYVTIERWQCDTLQDVAGLYGTYDSGMASRSNADINASFAAAIPELKEIPLRLVNLTVSAAAYLKWSENEVRRVPQAEKAEELLDRVDFVKWLRRVITSVDFNSKNSLIKHLLRGPVATAMLATYDKAPRVAEQFWVAVRDESAADRDDPTRVLARFLIRAALASGDARHGKDKQMVGFREMYVKCLHAWNAWRAGEGTSLNYHAKAPVPVVSK